MRKVTFAILLASSSMMLGGCQQLGSMFASRPASTQTASLDMSSYFAERLETGRRELLAHRPSQAVTAFRQASYDPATAAEAYNGMAIAYAQMGREDLARRFFMAALQANPGDERFVRNLARLDNGRPTTGPVNAFAATETPATELPPTVAATAPAPAPAAPAASTPVTRLSNREVSLARPVADTRRPAEVHISTMPTRTASLSSRVTVEGAPPRGRVPAYPVRVVLADAPARQPQYPVRIELPQTK